MIKPSTLYSIMSVSAEEFVKNWVHSKTISFKIDHTWKIDQFKDKLVSENKKMYSPKFSMSEHDIQFTLTIIVDNFIDNNEKYSGLFLNCFLGKSVFNEVQVKVNASIAFLGNDDNLKLQKGKVIIVFLFY